jgi:rSAM/selenodomain-associated transferase 2
MGGPALAVVIPTLNAAATLPGTLESLAVLPPHRRIVVDGGSRDATAALALAAGAHLLHAPRGRGGQLAAGAGAAPDASWLLFLHADTRLDADAGRAVAARMAPAGAEAAAGQAGYFRLALDHDHPAARRLERLVAWRCRRLALPYGDQGLLIGRALYEAVGGFRPLPLMEDVDLVRRLGRRRLSALAGTALTSAERYRRAGYGCRSLRNLALLGLFLAGVPAARLARWY